MANKSGSTDLDLFGGDEMGLMSVIMMALMLSIIGPMSQQVQAQTSTLQAQAYVGDTDPRHVHVTNNLSWLNFVHEYPYQPWVSAYIINDGPSTVTVGVNYPDDRHEMNVGETLTITRETAQDRIRILFFRASVGLQSDLRVTGEY